MSQPPEGTEEPPRQITRGLAAPELKTLRHRAGWSQEELEKRSGVSVATISRLERGGRAHVPTLDLLAEALGVSRTRLLRPPRKRS